MRTLSSSFVLIAALASGACIDTTNPADDTIVASIVPNVGASDVDPAGSIVLTFSRSMQAGMETYVAMPRGDTAGPTWADE
jgi:hypothetical protein